MNLGISYIFHIFSRILAVIFGEVKAYGALTGNPSSNPFKSENRESLDFQEIPELKKENRQFPSNCRFSALRIRNE